MKIFILIFTAAFVACGLGFTFYKPDRVLGLEAEFAFNVTDKKLLVGDAEHVVIGEVVSKLEETKDDIGPITTYSIEVQEEIKGALESSTITIVQRIGYDNFKKGIIKFEDDDYLVEGNSYVLILRYDDIIGEYRITTPKYGNVLAKEKQDKSFKEEVLTEFKEAVKNQQKPKY